MFLTERHVSVNALSKRGLPRWCTREHHHPVESSSLPDLPRSVTTGRTGRCRFSPRATGPRSAPALRAARRHRPTVPRARALRIGARTLSARSVHAPWSCPRQHHRSVLRRAVRPVMPTAARVRHGLTDAVPDVIRGDTPHRRRERYAKPPLTATHAGQTQGTSPRGATIATPTPTPDARRQTPTPTPTPDAVADRRRRRAGTRAPWPTDQRRPTAAAAP